MRGGTAKASQTFAEGGSTPGPVLPSASDDHQEQGSLPLLLLRQEPGAGPQAHCGAGRLHLRRVHQPLPGDHRRGDARDAARRQGAAGTAPEPPQDQGRAGRVRHQPGSRQEGSVGRRLQPLQARERRPQRRRGGARQEQCHARRAHRLREDAARADAGPHPRRPVLHRRRHEPDRGRLRRRGRGEHPAPPHPGRRLRRPARAARDHLHRRDRQDRPQDRQPVDHPRRVRRGCPAGAAEDPRGNGRQRAAAGRPQASRTRTSSRSTPRTSCSSAAGPSRASSRSSRTGSGSGGSASAPSRSARAASGARSSRR